MAAFDVLVVGGGTGNTVAAAAAEAGLHTALVETGPLGGTCLNRGCNPSKMLIAAADAVRDVHDAAAFHVEATVEATDYAAVVDEMDDTLSGIADGMATDYRERDGLDLIQGEGEFVGDRTVEVAGETLDADRVLVATGSRPLVPPIAGLDEVDYLTSREALYRRELPDSMVILGGGYIAVELGYVFETFGVNVAIVEMEDLLVPREDPDVAALFTDIASERHDVYTGHRATSVEETDDGVAVHAETADGEATTVRGEELLVALGRRPNTDGLGLESAGIDTDDRGFVETNDRLETTADGVWAQGDVAGNQMFKHSGDYETRVTVDNVVRDADRVVDYAAMPHAIFTAPQMAGVGATEADLEGEDYVVGRADYADTPMGRAKKLDEGFVKVLASPEGEILGCHLVGHEASVMVHEVAVAMRAGSGQVADVTDTIHAHPTLNKVVEAAFRAVGQQ
ncbi:dihydrolipoyl dehydrogenase [Halobacteriales archaeon Cl-PHB]